MFDALINGAPQDPGAQAVRPPKDQAEYENRVGMWQQFQEKVKSDPAFRFALVQSAVQMAQPIQPGQSPLGHVAQAFGQGTQAYALANNAMSEQQQRAQEMEMRKAESGAKVRQADAATEQTQAQTRTEQKRPALVEAQTRDAAAKAQFEEKALPKKLQELDAKISLSGSQRGYYDALSTASEVKSTLDTMYGGREAEAKIARDQAAAAASAAAARHADALAKQVNANVEAGKGWKFDKQFDKDTGVVTLIGSNPTTAEQRVIRSVPPMQYADAVSMAKSAIKAVDANTPGQVFGDSKERLAAYSRVVGEEVKSAQEAIQKLTKRYTEGGATVTTYKKDGTMVTTKLADVNDAAAAPGTPPAGTPGAVPPAATPSALPPEVAQAVRANAGVSGTYRASDGSTWRLDGRGGAAQVQGVTPGAPAAGPAAAPSTGQQPTFRDRSQLQNDPTIRSLDVAIQQAAAAKDSAKVQELTALREQHIQRNYLP